MLARHISHEEARKKKPSTRKPGKRVIVNRLAISFDEPLARQVRRAARSQTGGNVSAWLAIAAREHLRLAAMQRALDDFEARHGKLTQAEMDEAERMWPKG